MLHLRAMGRALLSNKLKSDLVPHMPHWPYSEEVILNVNDYYLPIAPALTPALVSQFKKKVHLLSDHIGDPGWNLQDFMDVNRTFDAGETYYNSTTGERMTAGDFGGAKAQSQDKTCQMRNAMKTSTQFACHPTQSLDPCFHTVCVLHRASAAQASHGTLLRLHETTPRCHTGPHTPIFISTGMFQALLCHDVHVLSIWWSKNDLQHRLSPPLFPECVQLTMWLSFSSMPFRACDNRDWIISEADPDFYAAYLYAPSQPAYVALAYGNWGQPSSGNNVSLTVPSESE
eukprot:356348-Chlamydomonas_euryale.AAC.9